MEAFKLVVLSLKLKGTDISFTKHVLKPPRRCLRCNTCHFDHLFYAKLEVLLPSS